MSSDKNGNGKHGFNWQCRLRNVMFPFIATGSYLVFVHARVVYPHYIFDEVRFESPSSLRWSNDLVQNKQLLPPTTWREYVSAKLQY
jgi:hypothetical protein